MTTPQEATALRKFAEAATPGPWIAAGPSYGASRPVRLNSVVQNQGDESLSIADDIDADEDATFIAAANPRSILDLLDTIDRLTADRDSWVQQASDRVADAARFIEERDGIAAARDTWQQQCKDRTDEGLVWWQQRNEANAERDACKMDAARLDWLCKNINIGSSAGGRDRWSIDLPDPGVELDTDKVFRAAIDEAIAKGANLCPSV